MNPGTSWLVVVTVGATSYLLRLLGLLMAGNRQLPPRVATALRLVPIALIAGLIVVQSLAQESSLVFDERLAGIGAAVVAIMLRAHLVVVVLVAVVFTAGLRALLS